MEIHDKGRNYGAIPVTPAPQWQLYCGAVITGTAARGYGIRWFAAAARGSRVALKGQKLALKPVFCL
jgi:hypothetical protein